MSGPKLIEMRRRARAARLQRNRDLCDQCDAEYARLCEEQAALRQRIAALGGDPGKALDDPVALAAMFREQVERGQDQEAARRYPHQVAFARSAVEDARLAVGGLMAALHARLRRARLDVEDLEAQREAAARSNAAMSDQFARIQIPSLRGVSEDDVAGMERLEAQIRTARHALTDLKNRAASDARDASPSSKRPAGRSLADWVATKRARESGVGPGSEAMRRRVTEAFERAAALDDRALWEVLMKNEAEFVRLARSGADESVLAAQVASMESALMSASDRAGVQRELRAWIDRAAPFRGAEVDQMRSEIRRLLKSDEEFAMAPLRERMDAVLSRAERLREHEARRQAVLESLRELGYTPKEGMQTALVKGGRLLMQKGDQEEYAVEVVADAALDRIQTSMVRFAEGTAMSQERKLRDREEEERWCGDHARLRQKLEDRGWESRFVMQRPPGEHPVRVIVDESLAARSKSRSRADAGPRRKARGGDGG